MIFKRKAYDELLKWKRDYADKYSVLLEGPRRVGKSTLAENFAINEYKSYILIDFANVSKTVVDCFDDIDNLNLFFLRLQAATGVTLFQKESVIIFDEIQLFPKARQAIKYLVKDGRYHYIETGSLISIRKNIKGIVIPSEEMKIEINPMTYEEFLWAAGNNNYEISRVLYEANKPVGQSLNRKLMKDFRLYMAIGGMPQAVSAYIEGKSFSEIDEIKRQILYLYIEDFGKIDSSGRIAAMFKSIPAQLSKNTKRYSIAKATNKKKSAKDEELFFELVNSKTVIVSYNVSDPKTNLSSTKDFSCYKLFLADTGLFVTLMFIDRPVVENVLYTKLLSDKLPANLGYLYENAVAQVIHSFSRELFYHTWPKEGSTHYYEIDFLISSGVKVTPVEVKSSGVGEHESITEFLKKHHNSSTKPVIISQKDLSDSGEIKMLPIYMTPYLL